MLRQQPTPTLFPYTTLLRSVAFGCVFFNDTATTEIYTLSLHDALPIWCTQPVLASAAVPDRALDLGEGQQFGGDRKSTRLNSSHGYISYAVFCLKKKKPQHSQSHPSGQRSCR